MGDPVVGGREAKHTDRDGAEATGDNAEQGPPGFASFFGAGFGEFHEHWNFFQSNIAADELEINFIFRHALTQVGHGALDFSIELPATTAAQGPCPGHQILQSKGPAT